MSSLRCAAEAVLPEAALAARLAVGTWRPCPGNAVAVWRDGALCALVSDGGSVSVKPGDLAYAVDAGVFRMPFGVAGLGPVKVGVDGQTEGRLGLNGLATLRLAHAMGLYDLLDGLPGQTLNWGQARVALRPAFQRAAFRAVSECCGEPPWSLTEVRATQDSGALRNALAKCLFREIYSFGLAVQPLDVQLLDVVCAREDTSRA